MREGEREVSVIAVLLLLRACNFEPKTAKVNKLLGKWRRRRKKKEEIEECRESSIEKKDILVDFFVILMQELR